MRQSEHILYITLIDFLIQLLFLALVIGVVYSITIESENQKLDPQVCKDAIDFANTAKRLTGISNLTQITDQLTALGPLNAASRDAASCRALRQRVDAVGGVDSAKKLLDKAIQETGQGLPSCLPNRGTLMSFDAYPSHIALKDYKPRELADFLKRIGVQQSEILGLSPTEFRNIFSNVGKIYPDCRFNVRLIEHSFDTRPRDAVRSAFLVIPVPAPDRK